MNAVSLDELEAAAEFLYYDLYDTADELRCRAECEDDADAALDFEEAADQCEALADGVADLPADVLRDYAAARQVEKTLLRPGGPDTIHCSMTMEIGLYRVQPRDTADLCAIYCRAVEQVRRDPRWADPGCDMAEFWCEFTKLAAAN